MVATRIYPVLCVWVLFQNVKSFEAGFSQLSRWGRGSSERGGLVSCLMAPEQDFKSNVILAPCSLCLEVWSKWSGILENGEGMWGHLTWTQNLGWGNLTLGGWWDPFCSCTLHQSCGPQGNLSSMLADYSGFLIKRTRECPSPQKTSPASTTPADRPRDYGSAASLCFCPSHPLPCPCWLGQVGIWGLRHRELGRGGPGLFPSWGSLFLVLGFPG